MLPLLTIFSLPADFVTSSTAYIGDMITDLKDPLVLIFGLILAMWVIRFIMSLVSRKGAARG